MIQDPFTEIIQNIEKYKKKRQYSSKIQDIQQIYLDQCLNQLNNSLLPQLRLNQKVPNKLDHLKFPDLYFENNQKIYIYDNKLSKAELEGEKFSPFVPENQNYNDIFANSKSIKDKNMYTVNQNSKNLLSFIKQNKQSKFYGEEKATFPTIILDGKEEHPIRTFPNKFDQKSFISTINKLGGINDNLNKFNIENLAEKKRKAVQQSFKKYSSYVDKTLSKSNTQNLLLQPPPKIQPKPQIKNPFIRIPSRFKQE